MFNFDPNPESLHLFCEYIVSWTGVFMCGVIKMYLCLIYFEIIMKIGFATFLAWTKKKKNICRYSKSEMKTWWKNDFVIIQHKIFKKIIYPKWLKMKNVKNKKKYRIFEGKKIKIKTLNKMFKIVFLFEQCIHVYIYISVKRTFRRLNAIMAKTMDKCKLLSHTDSD